jgi:hypothetical protein
MKMPYSIDHPSLEEDGWVHKHFEGDLEVGHEYGLFFPGTRLYEA